jgi:hypothetical protein
VARHVGREKNAVTPSRRDGHFGECGAITGFGRSRCNLPPRRWTSAEVGRRARLGVGLGLLGQIGTHDRTPKQTRGVVETLMVSIAETTNQASSDHAGFVVQQRGKILRVGGTLDKSSDHGTIRAKPASAWYSTSVWATSIDSGLLRRQFGPHFASIPTLEFLNGNRIIAYSVGRHSGGEEAAKPRWPFWRVRSHHWI